MIKITEQDKEQADKAGIAIEVVTFSQTSFINFRRKDNFMILFSFKDDGDSILKTDLTTMNAEDFEKIPAKIDDEISLSDVISSAEVKI